MIKIVLQLVHCALCCVLIFQGFKGVRSILDFQLALGGVR